jgi:hypothetical protein
MTLILIGLATNSTKKFLALVTRKTPGRGEPSGERPCIAMQPIHGDMKGLYGNGVLLEGCSRGSGHSLASRATMAPIAAAAAATFAASLPRITISL